MLARIRPLLPITLLAALLLTVPSALAAQGSRISRARARTSAEVIEQRIAEAEARERERLAWAARRPGVTLGSTTPAARPGVTLGGSPQPSGVAPSALPADVAGAVATDLRALARRRGWEERLEEPRIARLAEVIATESARYALPAALVIAIIHLESEYNPVARSSVGATGLMQVMPSWPGDLGFRFGTNLRDEATNVRYGTWVLQDALSYTGGDTDRALLRYNGCRTGSNTPNCFTYPDKIRALVEEVAQATCGGRGWDECVAEPIRSVYEMDL